MERMKKKRAGMSPRAMMIQQQAKNTTASFFDDVGVFPGMCLNLFKLSVRVRGQYQKVVAFKIDENAWLD